MSKVKKRKAKEKTRQFQEERRLINLAKKQEFEKAEKEKLEKKKRKKVGLEKPIVTEKRDSETLERIDVINELYDEELKQRGDYTTLSNRLTDIKLSGYLSDTSTDEEIDKLESQLGQINQLVNSHIINEIENNQNRIINKIAKFYNSELTSYTIDKLKEIASKDLDSFYDVEARLKDYLEDKDRYQYLMYDDRTTKDVQEGINHIVDNILLDYGVSLTELRKEHYRKLGYRL